MEGYATTAPMRSALRLLPQAVLLGAIAFSLHLQRAVGDEVFWSGDAGLKALMTQQFAGGELHADLRLPAETWVQTLWGEGLYPFEPPFVYAIAGRHYIQYPLAFPLVSAVPYRVFGWRGLYLLPLLSTWLLWGAFLVVCRRWGWDAPEAAAALAALALASPLTFYSATYWEHAPAVALVFLGLLPLLTPDRPTGRAGLVAHGVAFGLALWLREELFALLAGLVALALLARATGRAAWFPLRQAGPWFAGALFPVAGFLAANEILYGQPLGAHAFAVFRFQGRARLENALSMFGILMRRLVWSFPIALLALSLPFLPRTEVPPTRDAPLRFLVAFSALAVAGISFLLPDVQLDGSGGKQWGPRFLLVVIPPLCLLAGQVVREARLRSAPAIRVASGAAFLLLFAASLHVNLVQGSRVLSQDYASRVLPSVAFLRRDSASSVAVAHQFIAQETMPALPTKRFFLTRNPGQIALLADALDAHGEREFVYVSYPGPVPEPVTTRSGHVVHFAPIGAFDAYSIARASW